MFLLGILCFMHTNTTEAIFSQNSKTTKLHITVTKIGENMNETVNQNRINV